MRADLLLARGDRAASVGLPMTVSVKIPRGGGETPLNGSAAPTAAYHEKDTYRLICPGDDGEDWCVGMRCPGCGYVIELLLVAEAKPRWDVTVDTRASQRLPHRSGCRRAATLTSGFVKAASTGAESHKKSVQPDHLINTTAANSHVMIAGRQTLLLNHATVVLTNKPKQ